MLRRQSLVQVFYWTKYRHISQCWRKAAADKLTAYRDFYRNSIPVHEKSEDILKVRSLDDIVEHFLIKPCSGNAAFKHERTLFSHH